MPHLVTVTGVVGPGRPVTTALIPNVQEVVFLLNPSKVLRVRDDSDSFRDFDLAAVTTVTCSISAGNYTFTLS